MGNARANNMHAIIIIMKKVYFSLFFTWKT